MKSFRIILVLVLILIKVVCSTIEVLEPVKLDYKDFIPKEEVHEVLATKYNPVPEQCWGDPTITADMSKIDLEALDRHELKWIAVSRDLLSYYSYGDTVLVNSSIERLNGKWIIHDTMNKRWTNRIDFLVPLNDKYEFHAPTNMTIVRVGRVKEKV